MADRYTADQQRRIIESGEKAPDMGYAERIGKNLAVSIPRAATDMVSFAGMLPALVRTAVGNIGSSMGLTDDPELGTELYGKEGLAEVEKYVSTQVQTEIAKLPENYRNEKNYQAIASHYANSDAARDILLKHAPAMMRAGTNASNAINDMAGLNRVEDETIVDDMSQIVGQSILPFGAIGRTAATGARRAALRAVELALPGNTGTVGNAAANVAVGAGLSQGMRALSD